MTNSFDQYTGLDLQNARSEIGFPVQRESLISEQTRTASNKDILIRADSGVRVGVVPKTHQIVPYGDIMDWVTSQFDQVGVDYKLRESLVTNTGDLYQEYLFDLDVTPPDGEEISPLVILRGSYTGVPLQVKMGTYRFVCLNGVVVGETIQDMRVSAHNSHSILPSSIKDQINFKFQKFADVATKYSELYAVPFNAYLVPFLASEVLPLLMKKAVFYQMQEDGNIELTVEKLKAANLTGALKELYKVVEEQSAWYLYNVATQYATHQARSVNARITQYQGISQFFGV